MYTRKIDYLYQRTKNTSCTSKKLSTTCTRGRDKLSPLSVPAPVDRASEPWIFMMLMMILVSIFCDDNLDDDGFLL